MAKRKKKKNVSQAQQLAIADRELKKGNAKQAVKHAKSCFRVDPSESTRSLLQQALLLRGRQLHARGMREPAQAIVVELGELGEVIADYRADANRLRVLLGLHDDLSSPEILEDEGLRNELADQAVLMGPTAAPRGATVETAQAVRSALAAAETDQHEQAIETVRSIGRDSPYCDWKLFVRGLCAYYEGDDSRADANWSRLAKDRPARRIADTLSLMMTDRRRDNDAPIRDPAQADRLVRSLGTPLVGNLRVLQRMLHDPECESRKLFAELRHFMTMYAGKEPALARRVADIFIRRAIHHEDEAELATLKRFLPKSSLDPNLNRAAALIADAQGDLTSADRYWTAYVNDLKTCEALSPSQRVMATALVYNQLALSHVEASETTQSTFFFANNTDEYVAGLEREAIYYFRESLAEDPNQPEVYIDLGELLSKRGQKNEAAASFKELGRRFPNDAESLVAAASYFIETQEPGIARAFAEKARVLRPRDTKVLTLLWSSCLNTARNAAKLRQFRLAESELDDAEAFPAAGVGDKFILRAMRAAVAFKQGNEEDAERWLNETIKQFEQPTAALLLVDSQARRCGVPSKNISALKRRLTKAIKGRKTSQAAGVMAKYLYALELTDVEYQGLTTHRNQVEKYLEQCRRVRWQVDHLLDACRFASIEISRRELLEKLAGLGTTLFPNHPLFYFFVGQAEMSRGPDRSDRRLAKEAFERAIELDKTGDIPLEAPYCQRAGEGISLLDPCGPPRFDPRGVFDLDSVFDDDDDDVDVARLDPALLEQLAASLPEAVIREFEERGLSPLEALKSIMAMSGNGVP